MILGELGPKIENQNYNSRMNLKIVKLAMETTKTNETYGQIWHILAMGTTKTNEIKRWEVTNLNGVKLASLY